MKSTVAKHSIVIAGHRTSVSLEDEFWEGLREIANGRDTTLMELVSTIDAGRRQHTNLSSAIRLFVLGFYRDQIGSLRDQNSGRGGKATAQVGGLAPSKSSMEIAPWRGLSAADAGAARRPRLATTHRAGRAMTKAILPKKTERQTACAHDVGAGLVYVGQQAGELHHQGDDQHCGHADGCKGCQIAANSDPLFRVEERPL